MSEAADARRLIHELLDGSIGREDFARLHEILLRDPEARRDYYALLCTDQMLADNFEMPEHVAVHLPPVPPAARRRLPVRWLAAAAALLVLGISAALLVRANTPRVTMKASADCHFLIDGKTGVPGFWARGQVLEVQGGMVVAQLNEGAEACIDGEARLRLASNAGDLEMSRGRAFFRVSPGAPDFEVKVAGATLRHVGTDFGVSAVDERSCDIRVMGGTVRIERPGGETLELSAGEAASWRDGGETRRTLPEAVVFRQSAPAEETLFDDDFSEPAGTVLEGKPPDVGRPWVVHTQQATTHAGGGVLDTSGAFRHLGARLREGDGRGVILMTFSTRMPAWTEDKKLRLSGIERITLIDADGNRLCSVVALAREDHRWRVRDDAGDRESALTEVSALAEHQLTLRYDPAGGKISLHAGGSAHGEALAEVATEAKAMPVQLDLWNDYGGDLALTRLTVRAVR